MSYTVPSIKLLLFTEKTNRHNILFAMHISKGTRISTWFICTEIKYRKYMSNKWSGTKITSYSLYSKYEFWDKWTGIKAIPLQRSSIRYLRSDHDAQNEIDVTIERLNSKVLFHDVLSLTEQVLAQRRFLLQYGGDSSSRIHLDIVKRQGSTTD